jgi:hypothetical protein
MSRGAAGKNWEALKINGNFCDITQHGIRENASQFALYLVVLAVSFLAGDAVQIAPVSSQIPCKQGILQGISAFLAFLKGIHGKKSLCCRHFSWISLLKLTGKKFQRTGNFDPLTGNISAKGVN